MVTGWGYPSEFGWLYKQFYKLTLTLNHLTDNHLNGKKLSLIKTNLKKFLKINFPIITPSKKITIQIN